MNHPRWLAIVVSSAFLIACSDRPEIGSEPFSDRAEENGSEPISGEWRHYGQSEAGRRFSPLTQITPANVDQLEIAWTYHIGTAPRVEGISLPALEGDADRGRRTDVPLLIRQQGRRARSGNRSRALEPRSEDQPGRPGPAQLPRGHVLPRRGRPRERRLCGAHIHGHAGRPVARARRGDRPAVCRVRRKRRGQACDWTGIQAGRIRRLFTAGDRGPQPDHRRASGRQHPARHPGRADPRLRRRHRRARVGVEPGTAGAARQGSDGNRRDVRLRDAQTPGP